jgi:hypothetical protein
MLIAWYSSLATVGLEIGYHPSQRKHGTDIQFPGCQQGCAVFALGPALRDEGASAVRQYDIPIGLALLMVGSYNLDRLAAQRVMRVGDLHWVVLAVCSRCSLLGVLQSGWPWGNR